MPNLDIFALIDALITLLRLVYGALTLDAAIFRMVQTTADVQRLALLIVFLAGVAQALGQSVVLFANQVRPARFIASLLLSGAIFVLGYVAWIATVWLIGVYGFGGDPPLTGVIYAVSLGYTPMLFSFLILAPYLGNGIAHLLATWSFLTILVAVATVFNFAFWQALVCSALGWLIIQVLSRTVGRPLLALELRLRRATAGAPLRFGGADMIALLDSAPAAGRAQAGER